MYRRFGHGQAAQPPVARKFISAFGAQLKGQSLSNALGTIGELTPKPNTFDFLFEWTDAERLPPGPETVQHLKALGQVMKEDTQGMAGDAAGVPAAYTYFGQFLDHDITLDEFSGGPGDLDQALPRPNFLRGIENGRTASLELDSVYGAKVEDSRDPANPARMRLDPVTLLGNSAPPRAPIPGKSRLNDLPRQPKSQNAKTDRAAMIGDARNDENTIVAQLHAAFLKAHNTLVDGGKSFEQAREEMILRFQSAALNDFLARVCDPEVHADVMKNGARHWKVGSPAEVFMPAEFAYAAYRFGHSMVRTRYNFNSNFPDVELSELFLFTALSGNLGPGPTPPGVGSDTLPENWVIQWDRLLPLQAGDTAQKARAIDVQLTNLLFELRDSNGNLETSHELAPLLASRNLLRGYRVGLPTGQALAARLGIQPLAGESLRKALPTEKIRSAAGPFLERTPLWFYVLAEAGNPVANGGPGGQHLGKLGSTILMETLHTLVKFSPLSILDGKDHGPAATSTLADIIKLASRQDG